MRADLVVEHDITLIERLKGKAKGYKEDESPRFQDRPHMKMVSFVSSMHRPPLPLRIYPWYSFLLGAE